MVERAGHLAPSGLFSLHSVFLRFPLFKPLSLSSYEPRISREIRSPSSSDCW